MFLCSLREAFCDQLLENFEERFPKSSMMVATAFDVLGMKGIRFMSDIDCAEYGVEKIKLFKNIKM